MTRSKMYMIARAIGALGVGLTVAVLLARTILAPSAPQVALIKWGNQPRFDMDGWYDRTAMYDYVGFTPGVFMGRRAAHMDSLILRNPDIHVGFYFNLHTYPMWMEDAPAGSYGARMREAVAGRFMVTTEGDTASTWKANPMYDFFDPDVRADVIAVAADYAREYRQDWLFLDWASMRMYDLKRWNGPAYVANMHGEFDLDRDGVAHNDDPDEIERLHKVQIQFLNELRAALPPGVLLVPNGNRALWDDAYAAEANGCFVENFPDHFFPGGRGPWANAFDPNYPNSLHDIVRRNNGPVMLGNTNNQDWSHLYGELKKLVVCYYQQDDGLPPAPHGIGGE